MKKIPDNATKVFEGLFFSVWQWEQNLYDGSTKTFEYASRPDVSTVIAVTSENKIILCEEEQPTEPKTFSFPSGTVEKDETSEACALRELLEETGYSTETITHWFSESLGGRVDSEFKIFIAKNCIKKQEIAGDPGERISISLVTLSELLEKIESIPFKNKSIYPYLIKAKYSEIERQKLKELLGIKT